MSFSLPLPILPTPSSSTSFLHSFFFSSRCFVALLFFPSSAVMKEEKEGKGEVMGLVKSLVKFEDPLRSAMVFLTLVLFLCLVTFGQYTVVTLASNLVRTDVDVARNIRG